MAEYIERETLLKEMRRLEELARNRVCDTPSRSPAYPRYCAQLGERTDMVKRINEIPAADVVEVKHGRWVDRYGGKHANPLYECSECKEKALYKIEVNELGKEQLVQTLSATCPNCSAKMDGVESNGEIQTLQQTVQISGAAHSGKRRDG